MAGRRTRAAVVTAAALGAFAATADAATLTATDVDAICRVVYAEAGSEPLEGRVAVAAVIMTRMGSDRTAAEVVNARGQFEPVMRAGGDYRRLPLSEVQKAVCKTILELAADGMLVDPTSGATHFQNRAVVAERARKGTVRPSLVDFGGMPKTATIANHTFYKPGGETAARAPRKEPAVVSRTGLRSMGVTDGDLHDEQEKEEGETVFVVSEESQN